MSQHLMVREPSPGSPAAPVSDTSYRPEIQGLRALAVLMVVTYHVWFDRVSGGVDIFLFISAFLLSLSFIRKVEAGRPLKLGHYWLRRFKRLLPPMAVVLVATLAATALFVPQMRWAEILSQSWSSLLYFQNWALAAESVDYYAMDHSTASPLQHFWSLSLQGQVFILWPLLFAAAALLARAARISYRRVVLAVFGAVTAASLWFSVVQTYSNQAHAYFDTRTRLWEFALGTLLALALPYLKPVRWMRVAMGWFGLAVMLSVGFVLDVQGQFPGYVALVPLLAAVAIIVAGGTGSRFGADRLLSWKPLMRLGDMSYALYLWHWPVLVIYLIWRGRQEVGPVGGTAIIILSLVLAYLTTRLVERPLQSSMWANRNSRRSVLVIALCVAAVGVPVTAWQAGLSIQADRLAADADRNYPGAAVLLPGYEGQPDPDVGVLPVAGDEWPVFGPNCLEDPAAMESRCDIGTGDADFKVALVGSSHAKMWATPLLEMAAERGWDLTARIKGNCPLVSELGTVTEDCLDFNSEVSDEVLQIKPDVVVTTSTRTSVGSEEYVDESWLERVKRFTDDGIKVVAIRDTPRFAESVPDCLARNQDNRSLCGIAANNILKPVSPVEELPRVPGLVHLDFKDQLCPNDFCDAVIGNVTVYMDTNHITATYMRTMTGVFSERFDQAVNDQALVDRDSRSAW